MSGKFNAQRFNDPVYKKILEIEGSESISDWYALLGVRRFESDDVTITKAMQRRFELVRRYQVGKYEDHAQQLVDEIGRAHACLIDERARLEYDATLSRPANDPFDETIEAVLLSDTAFDSKDQLHPNNRQFLPPLWEPESTAGGQTLDTGAATPNVNGKDEPRRNRMPDAMRRQLEKASASSQTKPAPPERNSFRLPDWRGEDGTSVLPPLVMLILLIAGMVGLTRHKHNVAMERAQAAESEAAATRAAASQFQLTSLNSSSFAEAERSFSKGAAAMQAKRPIEAQRMFASAGLSYSTAINKAKREFRPGSGNQH